jgi:hypothetical protein
VPSLRISFQRTDEQIQPGSEIKINWNQIFASDDQILQNPSTLLLRPKYTVAMFMGEKELYSHEATIIIAFSVIDQSAFEKAWENDEARKIFHEKQIMKTLWPILRQQVLDGMTRLGLPGIPLPWII